MRSISSSARCGAPAASDDSQPTAPRRGRKPTPVVEFPDALTGDWLDPESFADALALHARRHGDSLWHLHKAIVVDGETFQRKTIQDWAAGRKVPQSGTSFDILTRIERRYRLPAGYFRTKLPESGKAVVGKAIPTVTRSEQRRLAWHLPEDFDRRPAAQRAEILEWVRTVVISGSTDYRRFQAEAMKHRYALRFPKAETLMAGPVVTDVAAGATPPGSAPPALVRELAGLIRFKTKTLTSIGEKRTGVWGEETAAQKIEHLALMFGAMTAAPDAEIGGLGLPADRLSMALLAFPAVWDWYLQWREQRRGFYTAWEINMLGLVLAMTRKETGWMWQNERLAERLEPIPGLVEEADVAAARADWRGACEVMHEHGLARSKEIGRVARVHRDPFEPIIAVLEAESPVAEYRRITTEILKRMPSADRYPVAAAEAVRGFLMLRLGLHLGVRQKNLRQLLVCPRGGRPRPERQLETLKRGELRWSDRDGGWEVVIPSVAFKNANSSFFGKKPFRLLLPDYDGLYRHIEVWLDRHRGVLLGEAEDPGTFFVKTVKRTSSDAAYDQATFYEAWRLVIQRYGIYNPWTGKGAIAGLLPHGPHNIRDVLATHILKRTGSYEQASYAIQDTPEMVAEHYGRFLPQDKAALAAQILNQVWAA
ncbi:hypothetical protein [Sphingomonas oryzagri]|uniref:Uncharacterized protein n=1 Tax=Sphingomonas oryzagri TaxID=3042314 RepID=A0ABT6N498_9SPHN|nr:hypothetical protein [Sphingomonas oryzagri]MDH7639987.1 hypothetical protein [Sphingomonas oryzagri]